MGDVTNNNFKLTPPTNRESPKSEQRGNSSISSSTTNKCSTFRERISSFFGSSQVNPDLEGELECSSLNEKITSTSVFPNFPQFPPIPGGEIGITVDLNGLNIRRFVRQFIESCQDLEKEIIKVYPKEQQKELLTAIKDCRYKILRCDMECSRDDREIMVVKAVNALGLLRTKLITSDMDEQEVRKELEQVGQAEKTSLFSSIANSISSKKSSSSLSNSPSPSTASGSSKRSSPGPFLSHSAKKNFPSHEPTSANTTSAKPLTADRVSVLSPFNKVHPTG